jgi:hypothetical protein
LLVVLSGGFEAAADNAIVSRSPQTVLWEGAHLAEVRARSGGEDAATRDSLKRVRENAELALKRGPYSVMQKMEVAPSGDKHDYLSYARYWWPNPDTTTGLPYIRRDGQTNKEALEKGDRATIGKMYDDVETLALAGYLLDEPRYCEHAARIVRAWFLDPATKMNPHMRFGQAVPGLSEGRGSGIIDTRHFIRVLDSVALLRDMRAWSDEDQSGLKSWMKQYLGWLRNDPQAASERSGHNNHGTWYDAQVAAIAMFVGERDLARDIVRSAEENRIGRCIQPDGSQPEELVRTKSLHYCVFNLSALSVLARIGEHVDVDLWHYSSGDGRGIRPALDFVMPYLAGGTPWPHEQIVEMSVSTSDMGLFYMATTRYRDSTYLRVLQQTNGTPEFNEYATLLYSRN